MRNSVELYDDGVDETKILEIKFEADQMVDTKIKPIINETPVPPGSILYGQIQKCALHFARMLWFNHIRQHTQEEKEKMRYDMWMEAISDSIVADRGERTKSVLISNDPRRGKLQIPVQVRDLAVLGDF